MWVLGHLPSFSHSQGTLSHWSIFVMFVPSCTVRWILTIIISEGLTAAHINLQMPTHIRDHKSLVLSCPASEAAEAQAMAGGTAICSLHFSLQRKGASPDVGDEGVCTSELWANPLKLRCRAWSWRHLKSFCTAKPYLTKQRPRKQELPQLWMAVLTKKCLQSMEYIPSKSDVHCNRNSCCCEGPTKGRYEFKATGSLSHSTSLQSLTQTRL